MNDLTFKYSDLFLDFEWILIICLFLYANNLAHLHLVLNKTRTNVCKYKGCLNLRFRKESLNTKRGHTQITCCQILSYTLSGLTMSTTTLLYLLFYQLSNFWTTFAELTFYFGAV